MSVYILLSTRNNILWLKECYKSLRDWTDLKENKLKVFNSACSDGTQEFLYENNIDIFNSMINVSGENSINFLLEQAISDKKMTHVCFIHDDMIFTKDWLYNMLHEMNKRNDCYCMGCMTVQHKKAYMIPDERRNLISEQLKEDFTGRAGAPMVLLKRECIEKVGYLDEGFKFGECSDNDYYKRIEDAGKTFLLTHQAVIFHGEKTTRCNLEGHNEYVKKSKEYFSNKWNGADPLKWGSKIFKYADADGEKWYIWGAR